MPKWKVGSGRHRESAVWKFYEFDDVTGKSRCTTCSRLIAGKNATNLKTHIRSFHKDLFQEMVKLEFEVCANREKAKDSRLSSIATNLKSCFIHEAKKNMWQSNSEECRRKNTYLSFFIAVCGLPTSIVDCLEFKKFCSTLDSKYQLPGREAVGSNIADLYRRTKADIIDLVGNARHVTIGLDIWIKKSSSYLGVSACFYSTKISEVVHVLLNLHQINHPYTSEIIAQKLDATLKEWKIENEQVLLAITDNGSNVMKSIRLADDKNVIKKAAVISNFDDGDDEISDGNYSSDNVDIKVSIKKEVNNDNSDDGGDETSDGNCSDGAPFELLSGYDTEFDDDSDDEEDYTESENDIKPFHDLKLPGVHCLPSISHSLQLVVDQLIQDTDFEVLIEKANGVVKNVEASLAVVEKPRQVRGYPVVEGCSTRWNDTLSIVNSIIKMCDPQVVNLDNLVASEWIQLANINSLLRPFAEHSDGLQKDFLSLSQILPAVLDLRFHLVDIAKSSLSTSTFANILLDALNSRFDRLLNTLSPRFEAVPIAACLLDPAVGHILLLDENEHLLKAAQSFVLRKCQSGPSVPTADARSAMSDASVSIQPSPSDADPVQSSSAEDDNTSTRRFRFVSRHFMRPLPLSPAAGIDMTVKEELNVYMHQLRTGQLLWSENQTAVQFWSDRANVFKSLFKLGQDLTACPAPQAYCERIFSICSNLARTKQRCTERNLEIRVFLKSNSKFIPMT